MGKNKVFLVHKFESSNDKHQVSFGKNLNRKGATKSFNKLSDAKKFALKKAIELKVDKFLMDLPEGIKEVVVPMKEKVKKMMSKKRNAKMEMGIRKTADQIVQQNAPIGSAEWVRQQTGI